MKIVTLSSKYQIAIPKEIRDAMKLQAGTRLQIITYGERIELVPIVPMKNLKGAFKGINSEIQRDGDRL